MRINTDVDPAAHQERSIQLPVSAACSSQEHSLEDLAKTLTQMREMISQSVTALTRIEQRLNRPQQKQSAVEALSNRELQILKLAATGRTNLQIASSLAQQMIAAAHAAQARTWTAADVLLLLRWLTPYPRPADADPEAAARATALVCELGGLQAARQRLDRIAHQWQPRYPLHSTILRHFLAGWERREIVRAIVDQGLYEDSRIYACIKELPERICEQLRRGQLTPADQAHLS